MESATPGKYFESEYQQEMPDGSIKGTSSIVVQRGMGNSDIPMPEANEYRQSGRAFDLERKRASDDLQIGLNLREEFMTASNQPGNVFMGPEPRWARADIPSLPGERNIRSYFSLNFGPRGAVSPIDDLIGFSRCLVLTNKRILLIKAGSKFSQGQVSLEIPVSKIESVRTTLGGINILHILFPIALPVLLITKRLEIVYSLGGNQRRIRVHLPGPEDWSQAINALIGN